MSLPQEGVRLDVPTSLLEQGYCATLGHKVTGIITVLLLLLLQLQLLKLLQLQLAVCTF